MALININLPPLIMGFCNGGFPLRIRVRSPSPRIDNSKAILAAIESNFNAKITSHSVKGRRIMVVVDSSREAKAALQWALSHTVQSHDTIVLLDVMKMSSMHGDKDPTSYAHLYAMESFCKSRKPEVEVELSLVEGKERGPTIVEEAKRQAASLLVLGQKKRSMTWGLLMMWARHRMKKGRGVVDYCIQNASCMTLAVRKKSRRSGGYLITSRHHKNFWLLA